MKKKINVYFHTEKFKIMLLLVLYIAFSELVKKWAEIYILEQSLELKFLLLSVVIVTMYTIPENIIVIIIAILLLLSIFGLQTGIIIYVLAFHSFLKLLRKHKNFHGK